MLLLGIFYSANKPLLNMYLRPVMEDLLFLFREGLSEMCGCSSSVSLHISYHGLDKTVITF